MMILNVLVGLAIGITATYFLIVPSIRQNLQKDLNVRVSEASDELTSKNQEIQDLKSQVTKLTKSAKNAKADSEESKLQLSGYSKLLEAFQAYQKDGVDGAKEILAQIDASSLDKHAKEMYDSFQADINASFLQSSYDEGYGEYLKYNYAGAAELLQQVVDLDESYHNGDAIYYLAQSYRHLQEDAKAAELYQKVIDEYPNTQKAQSSKNDYLPEVQARLGTQVQQ